MEKYITIKVIEVKVQNKRVLEFTWFFTWIIQVAIAIISLGFGQEHLMLKIVTYNAFAVQPILAVIVAVLYGIGLMQVQDNQSYPSVSLSDRRYLKKSFKN